MINPTNCSEFQTVSEGVGDQGTAVAFSSPFIAVNCGTLPFTPKMTITQLGGRKSTARGKEPGLEFNLNTTPGDANLKSVSVTLPRAFEIDQEHLGDLCDKTELATDQCKGKAAIGTVKDETPLLEHPLEGNAYAVTGLGGGVLPHVVFILGGQVTVMPQGESETINHGELKTTIPVIPDVPIGHFRLSLYGGRARLPLKHRKPLRAPTNLDGRNRGPKRRSLDPAGEGEDRLQGQAQEDQAPQRQAPPQPRAERSGEAKRDFDSAEGF